MCLSDGGSGCLQPGRASPQSFPKSFPKFKVPQVQHDILIHTAHHAGCRAAVAVACHTDALVTSNTSAELCLARFAPEPHTSHKLYSPTRFASGWCWHGDATATASQQTALCLLAVFCGQNPILVKDRFALQHESMVEPALTPKS